MMINKLKNNLILAKKMFCSEKFKALIMLSFFACFLASFNVSDEVTYEMSILYYSATSLYQNMMIAVLFISTIYAVFLFDRSFNTILRYKDKTEYFENLIIFVLIINSVIYVLYSFIGVLIMTVKYVGNINFGMVIYYNIPYVVYNLYIYLKYFIIIEILVSIALCIYKLFGKVFAALLLSIFIILKEGYVYSTEIISSFGNGHLFYGYFLNPFQYSNVLIDLASLVMEVMIIFSIYKLLKYLVCKYGKISIN